MIWIPWGSCLRLKHTRLCGAHLSCSIITHTCITALKTGVTDKLPGWHPHGHTATRSCDGGCLLPVVVRRRGSLVPGVGLFARRDISVGEELTFPYGAPNAGPGRSIPLEEQRRATPVADAGVGAFVGGGHGEDVNPGKSRDEASRAERQARKLQAGPGPVQGATGVGSTGVERSPAKRAPTPRRCLCGTSACLGFMPADPA